MVYYLAKIVITTALIILITEVSKRYNFIGALLASIPVVSVFTLIWLYNDTRNIAAVSTLSKSIFWLVIPSLALFVCLPVLLDHGMNFYLSLLVSIVITVCCYWGVITILNY